MTNGSADFLTGELAGRLARLRTNIGPHLAELLDRLLELHHWNAPGSPLLHPLGQPIVQLPFWTAELVEKLGVSVPAEIVADMAEASITGYLHVRSHDDLIDEGAAQPEEGLLLAEALLIRHQALLARHVGSSDRFWSYFESKGWGYCDAMLLERRLHDRPSTYGEAEFDSILRRSSALILPGAAILDLADSWDLLPKVEDLVWHIVRAGQLIDDLVDAPDDLARGNHTWLVRRLDGLEGRAALLERLGLQGGFDEIVNEVNEDLAAATDLARSLGAVSIEHWLAVRQKAVIQLQETFFGDLFGVLSPSAADGER